MSSTRENSQAQNFITEIFKIVAGILDSAGIKNQKINNLSKTNPEQSVDSLLKELSAKIQGDSDALNKIQTNLDNYKSRIDVAINNRYDKVDEDEF